MDGTLTDVVERWILPVLGILEQVKPDYDRENLEESIGTIALKSGGASNFLIIKLLWTLGKLAGLNFFQQISFFRHMIKQKAQFKRIVLVDGAEKVVSELSQYFTLALITSASADTVAAATRASPVFSHFTTIVTRDDVEFTKPNPEALLIAGKQLGVVDFSQVMMIGDFPLDVQAAKRAGAYSVAILGRMGEYTRNILEASHPDYLLTAITDLPSLLQQH